jgi:hypothetical protein
MCLILNTNSMDDPKRSYDCMLLQNPPFQYAYSVEIGQPESFLRGGELPTLIVQSTGHAVHVFINGQLSGTYLIYFPKDCPFI